MAGEVWAVYCYRGTREEGYWQRVEGGTSKEQTTAQVERLRAAGFVAHKARRAALDAIGLPEGAPSEDQFKSVGM
jgi:hypothetical protein